MIRHPEGGDFVLIHQLRGGDVFLGLDIRGGAGLIVRAEFARSLFLIDRVVLRKRIGETTVTVWVA